MRSIRLLITIAAAAALRPLIVFGRPGAGKSTIADRLVAHPDANAYNLDLDVCVSQRMRDNFARGIYPTLVERQAFASDAADYVTTASAGKDACCVVSFSFVNDDLRDSFRTRFPGATWALVDASDALAIALCHTQRSTGVISEGKGQRKPEIEALLSRMVRR